MSVLREKAGRSAHVKPRASAAFYDLDGTLCDLNLVHSAVFILTNMGQWSERAAYALSFLARAPRLYLAERKDRQLLNEVLFESFQGVSADRLFSLGEEYCERVLIKHLYPQAVELIRSNRELGFEPVLVTGSPDFIVAPLARHLEIEHFAANHLAMARGRANGRMARPVMASDEKARWCTAFAAQRGISLTSCWGYADSYYDLSFLSALGHPVAVNPDPKLRAAALSRQWPIISFERPSTIERELADTLDGAIDSTGSTDDGAA